MKKVRSKRLNAAIVAALKGKLNLMGFSNQKKKILRTDTSYIINDIAGYTGVAVDYV